MGQLTINGVGIPPTSEDMIFDVHYFSKVVGRLGWELTASIYNFPSLELGVREMK